VGFAGKFIGYPPLGYLALTAAIKSAISLGNTPA
jgi:hypothetical protein